MIVVTSTKTKSRTSCRLLTRRLAFTCFLLIASLLLAGWKIQNTIMEKTVPDTTEIAALMDTPQVLQVLFHPRSTPQNTPPKDAFDMDATVGDGIRIGCRMFTVAKDAPIIIFYHGNGEVVPDYDDIGPMYQQQGINFAIADYRGYGWSDGSPLLSTFLEDSNQVFDQIRAWFTENGYTGDVFVMGRSMGSACAIDIAVNRTDDLTGLVIDSGFALTLPLAKVMGLDLEAFGIHEGQTFDNVGKIEKFKKPTFMLHGQIDQLIPLWQAEKLHSMCGAKTKELQVIPGSDHNSLIAIGGVLYFQAIKKFIDKVTDAVPDWRERRKAFKAMQAAKQND
jgi:alpha-beta hydrolase superfamily lysophospholipase